MGIEDLEVGFGVIDLIFCLDGIQQCLKFDQGAALLLDEDDLADLSKVAEDVIDAIVVEVLG